MSNGILRTLILFTLIGCFAVQVHDEYDNNQEHIDNIHRYDSENNENRESVLEEYDTNLTKSSDCALRLNRSFAPTVTNPFSGNREYPELIKLDTRDCIRYSDINWAFAEAKKKYGFILSQRPYYDMEVGKIYELATILIETTMILAHRFQLNRKELNDDLPTIDMSKTDIWGICPDELKPTPCRKTRFRTIDGRCSSLKYSVWGATNTAIARVLYPQYDDGIDATKTLSVVEGPLPNVRVVSVTIHENFGRLSPQFTDLFMSWGQFFAHDLTKQGILREQNASRIKCCPKKTHPICEPINIPENDPFYSRYGERCMDFQRIVPAIRPGCALGPRVQMNHLTTRIDANSVYGLNEEEMKKLRTGVKGLIRMWDKFHDLKLKELLPPATKDPDKDCVRPSKEMFCFKAGDDRLNIQIEAAVVHTLHARYHNVVAKELAYLNPHWDDERIFQETRHIMAAVLQHIAYNELLPLLIGLNYTRIYNLTLSEGYWDGYDVETPMLTLLPFQMMAFRFGHSMVNKRINFYNKENQIVDSVDLHETFFRPFILYQPGAVDEVISGFLSSPAQSFDRFLTNELTERLLQKPNKNFGQDLAALDINRGRDTGLPGYNDYREWCGLPRINTFAELDQYLGNGIGVRYAKIYKSPDDIDLWSATLAEPPLEGAVVGPTSACIIGNQFSIYRKADHFWYENPGFPSSFTPGQLREIKKITLSKIICDNADDIPTIQLQAFILPDENFNPRVPCKDLPSINLEYWKEDPVKKVFLHQT